MSGAGDEGDQVEVLILGLPLRLYQRSSQHLDELLREFTLIGSSLEASTGARPVPDRLIDLVDGLRARYAGVISRQDEQRRQALDAGLESMDLVYRVPTSAREASAALLALLEEADEFCRRGDLLTLAAPQEVHRFRRWYLGQIVDQIDEKLPTAWPDHQASEA